MTRTDTPHTPHTLPVVNPDAEATFAAALPWVRKEAEKLAQRRTSAEFDANDLFQVGAVAAWKLAREWDATRSLFTTFAKLRVHGAMIDHVRNAAGCGFEQAGARLKLDRGESIRVVSFAAEAKCGECGDQMTVGDQLGACDPEVADGAEAEFVAMLRRVGAGVYGRDRTVMVRYFVAGETMKAVGQEVGLSESRVSQVIDRVVERIHESLRSQGRNRFTAFA